MNIINKQAIFIDNENNEQCAYIRIIDGISISINTFDSNNNATGYMNTSIHFMKKMECSIIINMIGLILGK